jgi:hypothetical protein
VLLGIAFFALQGISLAQATTNLLGLPVPRPTHTGKMPSALPDTVSAQSHPAPTPTPKAAHLAVSGKVRGYYFRRLNRVASGTNINKYAVAFGAIPHLDYRIGDSPINIGYTYGGSTGFGINGHPNRQREDRQHAAGISAQPAGSRTLPSI